MSSTDPGPDRSPTPTPAQPTPTTSVEHAVGADGQRPAGSSRRSRYQPRQRSTWERIPLSLKLLAPVALGTAVWLGFDLWRKGRTVVSFVVSSGEVPPLDLTFYADDVSFARPSPPPITGTMHVVGGSAVIGRDVVPDSAFVRIAGPGIGTAYTRVQLGREHDPIPLGPAGVLSGSVTTIEGRGLHGIGLRPVTGAHVIALGGGAQGIPLAETDTDAEGAFTLSGFDAAVPLLGIRVLAAGYAMETVTHTPDLEGPLEIQLVHTQPIRGRVVLPQGVEASTLRLLAKGLPGVDTAIAADGSFELDHVANFLEPRLLLYGLTDQWTHPLVNAGAGTDDVVIPIQRAATVRGFVLHRTTQQRVGGAAVSHDNGPGGRVVARSAEDGSFTLPRVPPGDILLRAQLDRRERDGRETSWSGERHLDVAEGVDQDSIIIRID